MVNCENCKCKAEIECLKHRVEALEKKELNQNDIEEQEMKQQMEQLEKEQEEYLYGATRG